MSTFHHVLGLWLAPDFSAVERGETPPPHIDYDAIDARGIADTLAEFNDCGEDVTIRFPNDAVDQVTIQFRLMGRLAGSPQCEDFAAELLNLAETSAELDVRAPWAKLHALPNRRQAPPPVLLMFVVSGDFDAVMVWSQQLRMRLGIRAAGILKQIAEDVEDADHEGKLPSGLDTMTPREAERLACRGGIKRGLASLPEPHGVDRATPGDFRHGGQRGKR